MDADRIQELVFKGYGIAAKNIARPFDVYRSASMMNPLDPANVLLTLPASFPRDLTYKRSAPTNDPKRIGVMDGSDLLPGDWLTDGVTTYFIAQMQHIVPIDVVECSELVSISRPSFGTAVGGGYESSDVLIAEAFPVFMINKSDQASSPKGYPVATDSAIGIAEWTVLINTREPGAIKAQDVITDSQGIRYQIMTPRPTKGGYVVTARLETP